jgi:hypothetical protein
LEHASRPNPQATAPNIGQKQAPEGFELDRKHYYVTKSKLDAVNKDSCLDKVFDSVI